MNGKIIKKALVTALGATFLLCNLTFADFVTMNKVDFNKASSTKFKESALVHGIPTEIKIQTDKTGYCVLNITQSKKDVYSAYLLPSDEMRDLEQIQDKDSGRIFYVINGYHHSFIYGYDSIDDKWKKYVDSSDYNSGYNRPGTVITVKDGEKLQLSFFVFGNGVQNHIYELFWDQKANRFGSNDLGYYLYKNGKNRKVQ